MISAVSPVKQIYFEVFEGKMNAARFIEFCGDSAGRPTPRVTTGRRQLRLALHSR